MDAPSDNPVSADEDSTVTLRDGDREFIIVGTAHVSHKSVEQVRAIIEEQQPDTVCVELCDARYQAMVQRSMWQEMDLLAVIRQGKAMLLLLNFFLASFQRRLARQMDIEPGQEMAEAIRCADSVDAKVVPVDRDIKVTLTRTWRQMGLWTKIRLVPQALASVFDTEEIDPAEIEAMKSKDTLQLLLQEMAESIPQIKTPLIDERDAYMAHHIRAAEGNRVVAVVGAGHVPGITRLWDDKLDCTPLTAVPPPGLAGKLIKWGLPALILALLVLGFVKGGKEVGTEMVAVWIASNAVFAGIGALCARGHLLTVFTAMVSAPLTSLNPMVAAGFVAGFVEAWLKKPQVQDFESLTEDIMTMGGWWTNRVSRLLLVVVLTNIGSSVGTFLALPLLVRAANFLGM